VKAPVECEGAPRDLGRDQGEACAAALRARFAVEPLRRRLRLHLGLASGSASALRRELRRLMAEDERYRGRRPVVSSIDLSGG